MARLFCNHQGSSFSQHFCLSSPLRVQISMSRDKEFPIMKSISCLAAALTLCAASSAMAQNIVQNSGFENGLTDWTVDGFTPSYGLAPYTHTGTGAAVSGCGGHSCVSTQGRTAYIAQTLNTVAGSSYNLSLWVGENGGPNSEMAIYWNGTLVADVLNPANNTLPGQWIQFNYKNLVASGNSTVLEIHGRQDPAGIYFDDISVTAAVPEPESFAMLIAGLGLLGFSAKRRKMRA